MTDEELKEYEVTLHSSNKENINFRKDFLKNLEIMYKRQLELSKEVMKKGFEK